jgi:hypothetical protein
MDAKWANLHMRQMQETIKPQRHRYTEAFAVTTFDVPRDEELAVKIHYDMGYNPYTSESD